MEAESGLYEQIRWWAPYAAWLLLVPLLLGFAWKGWLRRTNEKLAPSRIALGWFSIGVLSLDWLISAIYVLGIHPYLRFRVSESWYDANLVLILTATIFATLLKGRSRWQALTSGVLTIVFFCTRVVQ